MPQLRIFFGAAATQGGPLTASVIEVASAADTQTGALITAAVAAGAILGGGSEAEIQALTDYGESIGLAFQIADDILDVEGDSKLMGKGTGGDARKQKITYPAVVGLEQSKKLKKELIEQAITALGPFGAGAEPLRHLANYIIERKK